MQLDDAGKLLLGVIIQSAELRRVVPDGNGKRANSDLPYPNSPAVTCGIEFHTEIMSYIGGLGVHSAAVRYQKHRNLK